MPEQLYGELSTTQKVQRAFVGFELARLLCATMNSEEYSYQRKRADWVDNREHANAPSPRSHCEDSVGHITADPSIDLSNAP